MTTSTDWPELPAPFDEALRQATAAVLAHYDPVGMVAAGSILRGQGGPTSDIDLYVIHQAPFRQRLQRRYVGVPFEIFINPPQQVRRYFVEEHRDARPITAHMLATGFVVLDRDPVIQTLRNEAALWLAKLPNPPFDALRWRRYSIVDLLDNARDAVVVDPALVDLILHQVVTQLIEYRFLVANRHLPRLKDTLAALQELDADVGDRVRDLLLTADPIRQLEQVAALVEQVVGAVSFFEWDGEPERVSTEGVLTGTNVVGFDI